MKQPDEVSILHRVERFCSCFAREMYHRTCPLVHSFHTTRLIALVHL